MALQFQISETPCYGDYPFVNMTGTDIPAYSAVELDTTAGYLIGGANFTGGIAVKLCAVSGNNCLGIAMSTIKAGSAAGIAGPASIVRMGGIAPAVCDGAVVVGTYVDGTATASRSVKAHAAGKATMGIALATGADADTIPIFVVQGFNA